MIICQASLIGGNGAKIRLEKIGIPALTQNEDGDFLVSRYQASPFQIILLQGRAKLPKKLYCFKSGTFLMRDMTFFCDVNHALTIDLPNTTSVYVHSKTGIYDHPPTDKEQFFQLQPGDIITKGSVISLDPYYDAGGLYPSNVGLFIVTLD